MYDIALCQRPYSVHCFAPKSFLFWELIWLRFIKILMSYGIYRHYNENETAHSGNFPNRSLFLQRERVENTSRPGEMQVTIQNLMPATVYIFRVMAQNKHGSGESSAPLRVETQPEGKSPISLSAPPIGRPVWRATLYIAWHTIGVQKITVPHLQGPYKIVTGDQINSHQAVANSVRQYNSADRHPNFTDPLRLAQMPS